MSLSDYIKWCRCNRMILTTGQIKEGKPCEVCQKEHAKQFQDKFNIKNEEVKNGN